MSKAFVTVAVLSVLSLSDVALGRILWAKRGAKPEFFHPRRFVQEHPRAIDLSIRTGNIGNFGSCSIPQIKFGAGFDGRKETSFEPNDQTSYPHGSAQNIDIITQFMCDELVNTCRADQQAQATCKSAAAAADQQAPKTGRQADAFNNGFGIITNFGTVTPLDDQGNPVNGGTTTSQASSTTKPAAANLAKCSAPARVGHGNSVNSGTTTSQASSATNSAASSFGTCTIPEIKFAVGLDGRKETAFAPADQQSYNHGSADNIAVITNFMCLALTNTCKANQAAKNQCAQAQAAANAATPQLSGAQADAFNAVFGKHTDFAAVQPISNTGQPVANRDTSLSQRFGMPDR